MDDWRYYIGSLIWSPLLIAQFIMVFVFGFFNLEGLDLIMYIGWGIWAISMILGFLPMIELKRRGHVPTGKGYVHTTVLVDSGLYSIVRHPQYTAGLLLSLSLILISQSLIVLVLGGLVIPILYLDIVIADRSEVEKFGDKYREYMERVPRTNFLIGIFRWMRKWM
jgi:protein-S-isoprenylcysteine O-methyltransferase Ste14